MLKFDQLIFCGAIVRRDYPWSQFIDYDLVRRALNDSARLDFWARVVEWVVPDAGQSGLRGFEDSAGDVWSSASIRLFGHSD